MILENGKGLLHCNFLQDLINCGKEHIPLNCLKVKEHYLKDPDFNSNYVHTKSFAAAGLCAWVSI